MKTPNHRIIFSITALIVLAGISSLQAAGGTWTNDASGSWGDTANWLGGIVADGSGSTADFSSINITADRTVTLDAAHTISRLNFGDTIPDHSWTLSGVNTLTLGTSPLINVFNQSATISSVIAGTAGLAKTGAGVLTLGGATDTYTGGTTIDGGVLTLDYNAAGSPTDNLIPSQVITLGGGTLNLNGTSGGTLSQAFGTLTLNAGSGAITLTPNGAASLTATLGTMNRPAVGTIVFNGPATIGANNVAVAATGTITTTSAGEGSTAGLGILCAGGATRLSWGTVGLYDWASTYTTSGTAGTSPYAIIGGSQVPGFYTAAVNGATTGNNIDFTLQQIPGTSGQQPTTVGNNYSMRYNSPHAPRGNTSGNVQTGGILVTPNLGTINAATDAIRLINASGVVQNNTGAVFVIGQFQSTGNPFVKSGAGTLFINPISGNNLAMNYEDAGSTHTVVNYTGYNYTAMGATGNAPEPPYLNGGVTVINSTYAFSCQSSPGNTAGGNITVNLNGGTLLGDLNDVVLTNTLAASSPRNVFLGGNGGGLASDAGHTLFVPGAIADFTTGVPGSLTIGIPASAANGNVAGLVPGTGGSSDNTAIYGTGTVDLSGGASTYTGGTVLQTGTAKINGINNLGGSGTYGGLTFNGGTLQYAAVATGYGSLDLSSGKGITLLAGGGTVDVNGNNVTYANAIGNGGGGALTVASTTAGGVLNLSGANTYTGNTTINSGATLNVNNTSGSGTGSGNVTVNGTLGGSGIISGDVTVQTGGKTLPGGVTTTLGGNLTYNTGASANFTLTSSATDSGNGEIVLDGAGKTLTFSGTSTNIGINCGSVLDLSHDYLLFNLSGGGSPTISGTLNFTPTWLGTQPAGYANYVVMVTNGTQVVLHYASSSTPPLITASSASPNPVLDYQALTISASVTPGSGAIDPNTGVKVDLSPIGGSSTQSLIYDGAGNYTNTVIVSGSVLPGDYTLSVAVLDSDSGAATADISLTVGSSVVWSGADAGTSSDWSDGANWASGFPPGVGVDLHFAGSVGLTPVMDSSYAEASVTFDSGADAFNLANSGGSLLTLTTGVTNNSANVQTLSLPVALGGAVTLNAASDSLTLNGVVSGSGVLTVAGPNTTTLTAANTYTGNTTVNAGSTLTVSVGGELSGGTYAGNIANNGTFVFNSTNAQTVSGIISGGGTVAQLGTNTLTLTGVNTYTGPTTITNGALIVSGSGSLNSGNYAGNIENDGMFLYQSSVGQTLSGIISGTGSNILNSAVGLSLNGANTYAGGTYVNEGTLSMNNTVACIGSGPVILGAFGYSGTVSLANGASGTYTNALIVNPGGTREYYTAGGPTATWAGLITLVGGATFEFGPNANINQTISGGTAGNGTLDITYPQANRNAVITVTGGAVNHVGTLENTMGGTTGTAQIDAVVGPNVTNVLQNSSCPMNLTATNTYAGPTTISKGTLYLIGGASISNSTVISVASGATFDVSGLTGGFVIASGQTLNGSGSINGAVTVGGTLAPTNSAAGISTLTFTNDLTLAGAALFALNRTNTQTASEAVGLGAVAFGGTLILTNTGTALQSSDSFTLFTASSGFSGSFAGVTPVSPSSNLAWDTNHLGSSGVLDVYTFATTPLTLSTPVNTPATIGAPKLANHVSSVQLGTAYPATGWTATVPATTSQGGSAVINGDGSLTYTPPSSIYTGSDSFTVTFQDGHGSQTMAVSVTVGSGTDASQNQLSAMMVGGNFVLSFAGVPGTPYTVETNANASGSGWTKMGNYTAPAGGIIWVTNGMTGGDSLFYRTVWPAY